MKYDSCPMIRAIVVVLVVGTMMCSPAQGAVANFYVATNGNDAWSGKLPAPNAAGNDGPFATLSRARDAIRELKANGGLHQPVKVLVRGGTYYLAETFTLESQDSGTISFPITYMAYPGAKVVLSGGRPVTGWKPYQGNIWQCDLKALGLGKLTFKQLFYNGERQPLARFPNVDPQRPRTGGFLYIAEGGMKGSKKLLKYDPSKLDPSRWANPTIAEVNVCPYHNWNNNIMPIAEIDTANHIITLARNANYTLTYDTRFYIRNAFEELDAPGEWYLDSKTKTLYFWPPDDDLAQGQVVVPALDNIIHIKGEGANNPACYLRIGGFAIQACQVHAVHLTAAQHCTVAKCTITNTGHHGVHVDGSDNRVVGNDIAYTGAGGIYVDGRNNLFSNNHIYDTGVILKRYPGITIRGRGNIATHNLIHDVPAFGMTFRGHDNILEYNEIHHVGLETNLPGGIYSWVGSDSTAVGGTIIRFNRVSDAVGWGMPSPGQWQSGGGGTGIWLDGRYVSDNTIYGNILIRNKRTGVDIHGGLNNIVENNIMGSGIPSTCNHVRPEDVPCHNRIVRNIVYYANIDPWLQRVYGWTMKTITETTASASATPVFVCGWSSMKAAIAESDYNLLFPISGADIDALLYYRGAGTAWRGSWVNPPVEDRFSWWRSLGYEAHSIIADPLFVDVANDDFRLQPDSPAFKLGFKPIPQERIGLYPSPNRASWPPAEHWDIWREDMRMRVAAEPKARPEFKAAKDTTAIIVDGEVGEWPWHDTTQTAVLQQSSSGAATNAPKSYACAAYDDEALYIAVRNLVRDPKLLKTEGEWGGKDGLEIALEDISGDVLGPILNLYGYPDGQFESVTTAGASEQVARKLGETVTYAAQIGAEDWSCEWRIPWAATGIDPSKAKKLWFNIGVRKIAADAWVIWEGTGGTIYWLDNAGDLVLVP